MPLYKTIQFSSTTTIHIWKIEEDFNDLFDCVALTDKNTVRVFSMKSEQHQRGFMSVRMLLQHAGYKDSDLIYDDSGKPHLNNGKHISISHSHEFSAIILSDVNIGIDLELRREKVALLADKFCDIELAYLDEDDTNDYISRLTVIWGVKESIFKIRNEIGISFKDHIVVHPFNMPAAKATATLDFNGSKTDFEIYFEEFETYTLVYAFEK
ncbi:MAG TPA: 4'-phosphopantetheinyl transferase superfamily protein [Flavobacterium sp.]|jgi:phosphopantetheinyl transferase